MATLLYITGYLVVGLVSLVLAAVVDRLKDRPTKVPTPEELLLVFLGWPLVLIVTLFMFLSYLLEKVYVKARGSAS